MADRFISADVGEEKDGRMVATKMKQKFQKEKSLLRDRNDWRDYLDYGRATGLDAPRDDRKEAFRGGCAENIEC